ncbi:MAG: glycoside hydrolase family 125 protein, partial [Candidatus Eremiobacteraeota bacterium]|nr:glycoside hydrolase family 125 protein [Candidatus Eremiobacteraeota bacterium]
MKDAIANFPPSTRSEHGSNKMLNRFFVLLLGGLLALSPLQASALEFQSIVQAASSYHNPNARLEALYRAALLDTGHQATIAADGTTYVKTGDIPAEWLRDSSAQARPYLFFAKTDPQVRALLHGIIARQAKYLQVDPYANAFTLDYRVWEQKFELDSLAYPIILAWSYWKTTGDASIFSGDESLAFDKALGTMQREQDHPKNSRYGHREMVDGKGRPAAFTGMIWSGFRPSDDACYFNFLIPSNMMAVVALGDMSEIERDVYHNLIKAHEAKSLEQEVQRGIQTYGLLYTPNYGYIYAYEVDGLGDAMFTDDANIPSLLSAPYMGYLKATDKYYQSTRRFLLSADNPTFYTGSLARGIGSQHTADHWVWPLALIMQGMTATTQNEQHDVVNELIASDPGDHLLHESFDPNDPAKFTRMDFGWPNALFSEYM